MLANTKQLSAVSIAFMATVSWFGKQVVNARRRTWRETLWPAALVLAIGVAGSAHAQTEIPKTRSPVLVAPALNGVSAEPVETERLAPTSAQLPVAAATPEIATTSATVAITAIRIKMIGARTVFEMDFSQSTDLHIFTLSNPYRVVIDGPDLDFRVTPGRDQQSGGLIAAYRYGLFGAGQSRVVIDLAGPARVVRSDTPKAGAAGRLQLELGPSTDAEFVAAQDAAGRTQAGVPQAVARLQKPAIERRPAAGKFIVMIDAGHGGVDGGAVAAGANGSPILEKDIVLAVARLLRDMLAAKGRFEVRMTRSADAFVTLDQRVALSEAAGTHLFISIHADSVSDATLARTVRGATVYTLSETASNKAAQALADKENSADIASGIEADRSDEAGQISSILADLVKRETSIFASEFRRLLFDRLRPAGLLSREPGRSAAFKVLRQTQTPTVLIELGFLTNQTDAEQMQMADWQKRMAGAIAAAVESYAGRRATAARQ